MDEKKGFSISAILAGGLTIYLGGVVLGFVRNLLLFGTSPLSAFGLRSHAIASGHTLLPHSQMALIVAQLGGLVLACLISVAGGAVAGSIAPCSKAEHGMFAGLAVALVSLVRTLLWLGSFHGAYKGAYGLPLPVMHIIGLVITVGLAWLGGRLAEGSRKQTQRY